MVISESEAKVPLQILLDQTVIRHFETKTQVEIEQLKGTLLILYTEWEFDGSSGQPEYNQKFSGKNVDTENLDKENIPPEISDFENAVAVNIDADNLETGSVSTEKSEISDSNLFMTSIVPLQMVVSDGEKIVVWKNNTQSSTRFCRPLHIQLKKETLEVKKEEHQRVENEISTLKETEIKLEGGGVIKVQHSLEFTMIDGKVAQIATDTTSAANCNICAAKPSEMNNLDKLKKINPKALKLGMSPLHARIKFMEYILHLSYGNPIKKWRVSKATKAILKDTVKEVQLEISKLGIKVDKVK